MSDSDLRNLLNEIIVEIDSGQLRVPRRRGLLRSTLAPAMLAASLGLAGGAGCGDRAIGWTDDGGAREDATSELDGGSEPLYAEPFPDSGVAPAYGIPPTLDSGPQPEYAEPFLDAGSYEDYAAPDVDGGNDMLYGVPEVDAGEEPLYAAPPPETDPAS